SEIVVLRRRHVAPFYTLWVGVLGVGKGIKELERVAKVRSPKPVPSVRVKGVDPIRGGCDEHGGSHLSLDKNLLHEQRLRQYDTLNGIRVVCFFHVFGAQDPDKSEAITNRVLIEPGLKGCSRAQVVIPLR